MDNINFECCIDLLKDTKFITKCVFMKALPTNVFI